MGDVLIAMGGGGGGLDTDEYTATRAQVLSGYTAGVYGEDEPALGGMPNNGSWGSSLGINGDIVIPEGYHNGQGRVRQSVATMGGQTITPGASQQVVSCNGKYMTGDVVVNSVGNLTAENIKKDVVVGGIKGSCEWTFRFKYNYQKADINVTIPSHDPNDITTIPLYTFTVPGTENYPFVSCSYVYISTNNNYAQNLRFGEYMRADGGYSGTSGALMYNGMLGYTVGCSITRNNATYTVYCSSYSSGFTVTEVGLALGYASSI